MFGDIIASIALLHLCLGGIVVFWPELLRRRLFLAKWAVERRANMAENLRCGSPTV